MNKKIVRIYKRFYLGLYIGQKKISSISPEWSASCMLGVMFVIKCFILSAIIEYFFERRIIPSGLPPILFGIIGLLIAMINNNYLVSKGKIVRLVKEFENESTANTRKWILWPNVIFVFTMILLVCISLALKAHRIHMK